MRNLLLFLPTKPTYQRPTQRRQRASDGTEMVRLLLSKGADPTQLDAAKINVAELNCTMRYWIAVATATPPTDAGRFGAFGQNATDAQDARNQVFAHWARHCVRDGEAGADSTIWKPSRPEFTASHASAWPSRTRQNLVRSEILLPAAFHY